MPCIRDDGHNREPNLTIRYIYIYRRKLANQVRRCISTEQKFIEISITCTSGSQWYYVYWKLRCC